MSVKPKMSPSRKRKADNDTNANGIEKSPTQSEDDEVKAKVARGKSVESEGTPAVGPSSVATCCEIFEQLMSIKPELKHGRYTHFLRHNDFINSAAINDFLTQRNIDLKELNETFRRYYSRATQPSVVSIGSAVQLVNDYANSGESVELHPQYPKAPKSAYLNWVEENHIKRFEITKEQLEEYKEKKQKLAQGHVDLQKDYLQKLESFVENESDLSAAHIEYVNGKIRALKKKLFPQEQTSRTPKKIKNKQNSKKSAFDFFKMSKSDKYTDRDPADRDRKLLKRFNKLSEEMRQIFLDLERAQ